MKKEIRQEINKLFEEMKIEIKKVGLQKEHSHYSYKSNIHIYISKTIGEFRLKALKMVRDTKFLGNHKERVDFLHGFGRKTTPYYWLKKELII